MKNKPLYSTGRTLEQFRYSSYRLFYLLSELSTSADLYFGAPGSRDSYVQFNFDFPDNVVSDLLEDLRYLEFEYFVYPSKVSGLRHLAIHIPVEYFVMTMVGASCSAI